MARLPPLLVLLLLLAACARPPGALRGTFAPLTVRDVQARPTIGDRVRWGGEIVAARPRQDETCLEVLSRPLDRRARPIRGDQTLGRFVACASGFYDPTIYAPGRELTVTGTLADATTRKVGDYEYRFPVVKADLTYLWPPRPERVLYYDPWPDPFWGPYWGHYPYWGWGPGPWIAAPGPPPRPPHPRPHR
jgi:outer membrane lipoprotein